MKRVFLIVLDSVGIGQMPDAKDYGDEGSNTLKSCFGSKKFFTPNLKKLGLFNIDGIDYAEKEPSPTASFAKMSEKSKGKDTIIGHWEIAGVESKRPLPTYKDGFPSDLVSEFERLSGYKTLCNKPYSGTKVIEDYGQESIDSGKLIIYTSADSVFQIAAHEDFVPLDELYRVCEVARSLLQGEHGVGRVIARPFKGESPNFYRTSGRHDYALTPPCETMLDVLKENGKSVIAVGKINDIFGGKGVTEFTRTTDNADGIEKTLEIMGKDFEGLCFVNLVDFDMVYGHRNNVDGYAEALSYFDSKIPLLTGKMKSEDILIITADHGCDPGMKTSTDHSREYTPMIIYGKSLKSGVNLGVREFFGDTGATILDYFGLDGRIQGKSFLSEVV